MIREIAVAAVLVVALPVGAFAADANNGKALFSRCAACHTITKGGPNGIGPNLFGVVGRKAGTVKDFSYSAALKGSGITWNAANLDKWIEHPAALVPGNRMAFAGISDSGQRADLIAYLSSLK